MGKGNATLAKGPTQLVEARLKFALAVASDLVNDTAIDGPGLAGRAVDLVPREFGIQEYFEAQLEPVRGCVPPGREVIGIEGSLS